MSTLAPATCRVAVVTGFIGQDNEGRITTLGRGGSDLTASTLGAAVGMDEIQVWKDVNGEQVPTVQGTQWGVRASVRVGCSGMKVADGLACRALRRSVRGRLGTPHCHTRLFLSARLTLTLTPRPWAAGIMTANPKVVPDAVPVPFVSFEEASELAYFGAEVRCFTTRGLGQGSGSGSSLGVNEMCYWPIGLLRGGLGLGITGSVHRGP